MQPQSTSSRRNALAWIGGVLALPVLSACGGSPAAAKSYRVTYSDAEWRKRLSAAEYRVMRQEGTERPYSSPLNDEHRKGTFLCKGCDNELYSSSTKFDSHTGWPSFWRPLPGAIGTSSDRRLGYARTEVHCADCGSHLGHVFDDGPPPTGKRYCMNGVAMHFRPA